jgi:hypothetical protein
MPRCSRTAKPCRRLDLSPRLRHQSTSGIKGLERPATAEEPCRRINNAAAAQALDPLSEGSPPSLNLSVSRSGVTKKLYAIMGPQAIPAFNASPPPSHLAAKSVK